MDWFRPKVVSKSTKKQRKLNKSSSEGSTEDNSKMVLVEDDVERTAGPDRDHDHDSRSKSDYEPIVTAGTYGSDRRLIYGMEDLDTKAIKEWETDAASRSRRGDRALEEGVSNLKLNADSPDRNWCPRGSINDPLDDEEEDDHLDYSGAAIEVSADDYANYYSNNNRRPRTHSDGSLMYSSFIPPIPKKFLPKMIQPDKEVRRETEQETRARILETMKQTKYYDQPASLLPRGAFPVKFLGVNASSHVMVQFNDSGSEKQYLKLKDTIRSFFASGVGSQNITMPPSEIDKGRIVLAKWQDGEAFKHVRACVIHVNKESETVEIRDCDEWKYKTVPINNIFYMLPGFMDTPFKVQKCKLKGLEMWHGTEVLFEMIPLINEINCVMVVSDCEIDKEDGLPILTLQASEDPTKDITLNAMLKYIISGFTRIPKQFVKGMLIEKAHLTTSETTGEVWIQMHSNLAGKLCSLGDNPKKCDTYVPKFQDAVKEFEWLYFDAMEVRFLARFKEDQTFYRVEVLQATRGSKNVKVQYLDFGNIEVINIEDILPIQAVDPTLGSIRMQVFKAYLNGIDEVFDWDKFFDHFGATTIQRFMVAGFKEPNVPLLDAYAKMNPKKPDEWVFVNQFILDTGLAKGPGVPNPLTCGSPISNQPSPKRKIPMKLAKIHEKKRFYSSCRVSAERKGLFGYLIKNQH